MHSIDKSDKEMRREYWGFCISEVLENNKFTCDLDYESFHTVLKSLLNGVYIQPLENYEKWDGNFNK
jgi:hypothetical protein